MKLRILATTLVTAFVALSLLAPGAWAKKVHKTFKNESAVAANDFHVESTGAVPAPGIENASAKHVETGNQAFPDSVWADPPEEFDWNSDDNQEEIPAGEKLKVCAVLDGNGSIDGYFTRNGVALDTDRVASVQNILPDPGGETGTVAFTNEGAEPLVLINVEVRINNSGDPDAVGEFVPDGDLVPGIPTVLELGPGEMAAFPYSGADPTLAISMSDEAARASDPSDLFFELAADYPGDGSTPAGETSWGEIKNLYR